MALCSPLDLVRASVQQQMRGFARSNSPSFKPPHTMTPTPGICGQPCPASARASASCCAMQSMRSTVFPRDRRVSPLAVWSHVPRNRPGNAWEPQAQRSALPISHGPVLKPLACACATIRQRSTSLARLAKNHDTGNALTVLAHTWARAVYDLLTRHVAFAKDQFFHRS